jgi:glycosyltransferase involved in cell wall biosynthesis
MKLTICLVTKGRKEYLEDALKSYEKFLDADNVDVILIDNGSELLSRQILLDWKLKYDEKVSYFRIETNNPSGFTAFWEIVESFNPDWILNPGDDDILVFDIYTEWIKALEENPELDAFASSAMLIDSFGRETGEIRTPAINQLSCRAEITARSLYEPPFFWPALFFRFSAIPKPVLISRFVHDWWIGLQILAKDQILTTSRIGVKYRVHRGQESFQTSNRRKYFEGYNMLTSFIQTREFKNQLDKLSDSEKEKLIELCIDNKLLYSQPEYFMSLIKDLTIKVVESSKSASIGNEIFEKYTMSAGVYTKRNDLENLYTGLTLNSTESRGNLSLSFSENVCKKLRDINEIFNETAKAQMSISCNHSKYDSGSILIDCDKFNTLNEVEISDSVLVSINEHVERNGLLSFTISPFERAFIVFYRKLKFRVPKIFKKHLLFSKKLIESKNEF